VTDTDDPNELIRDGEMLAYGSARTRLHSEAVRLADLRNDLETGFTARLALIVSGTFGGDPNLALVAFAWCLGQHDANPDRFPMETGAWGNDLLWMYKWIGERVSEHPAVTRAKIVELLEDMSRRYRQRGLGMRAVRKVELFGAINMFDQERILPALAAWLREKRDSGSDCRACDADYVAAAYLAVRDLESARLAARPILERRLSCAEIPTLTFGRFLLPLTEAGEIEAAKEYAALLPRRIGTNRVFVTTAGALVAYHVGRRSPAGLTAARRYAGWALEGETPLRRLVLILGLLRACRMAREMGKGGQSLGPLLPNETPSTYEDAESRLTQAARGLGDAFDVRNGHTRVGDAVREELDGGSRSWWSL
jgi:hypothetical protein